MLLLLLVFQISLGEEKSKRGKVDGKNSKNGAEDVRHDKNNIPSSSERNIGIGGEESIIKNDEEDRDQDHFCRKTFGRLQLHLKDRGDKGERQQSDADQNRAKDEHPIRFKHYNTSL